jgi:hypothetical protein
MKENYFDKTTLYTSLMYGTLGGVLLVLTIFLSEYFNLKGFVILPVFPLVIILSLLVYKRKTSVNFWRAVLLSFLVYCVMTFLAINYMKFMRWVSNEGPFLSFSLIPFLKIVASGVVLSVVIGLFFLKRKNIQP